LQAKQLATAIKNNVAVRFWKRQWFCLKTEFPNLSKAELRALQQRIYNGEVGHFTVPARASLPNDGKPMAYHLKANSHLFLPAMYETLRFLEQRRCKLFSLLPLRRSFVPSAILLDSEALYELTRQLPNDVMTAEVRDERRAFRDKVSYYYYCILFKCIVGTCTTNTYPHIFICCNSCTTYTCTFTACCTYTNFSNECTTYSNSNDSCINCSTCTCTYSHCNTCTTCTNTCTDFIFIDDCTTYSNSNDSCINCCSFID
jgi:hypothetical protein